jgi:hypothetical protein
MLRTRLAKVGMILATVISAVLASGAGDSW